MKKPKNLLKETLEEMSEDGYKPEDIVFIGSYDGEYSCTWEEFKKLADHEYDPGFGATEVAQDLVIVFGDLYFLCRLEYDGSEWWHLLPKFKVKNQKTKPIKNLFGLGDTVQEINSLPT